tara:strand:- start:607 stop:951 length:345 start_codon:yes stop_codon:yes gene_type:complete
VGKAVKVNTSRKNQVHWCTNLLGLVVDIRGEAERLMKPVGFSPSVCCEAASVFFDFDCGAAVCFFFEDATAPLSASAFFWKAHQDFILSSTFFFNFWKKSKHNALPGPTPTFRI